MAAFQLRPPLLTCIDWLVARVGPAPALWPRLHDPTTSRRRRRRRQFVSVRGERQVYRVPRSPPSCPPPSSFHHTPLRLVRLLVDDPFHPSGTTAICVLSSPRRRHPAGACARARVPTGRVRSAPASSPSHDATLSPRRACRPRLGRPPPR